MKKKHLLEKIEVLKACIVDLNKIEKERKSKEFVNIVNQFQERLEVFGIKDYNLTQELHRQSSCDLGVYKYKIEFSKI